MALDIRCDEHLAAVRAFADETGQRAELEKQLDYLGNYAQGRTRCVLFSDFAPQSFYFEMLDAEDGRRWFNGGLIYHGPHDRGGDGGAPTFSVNLVPHYGWSVHT